MFVHREFVVQIVEAFNYIIERLSYNDYDIELSRSFSLSDFDKDPNLTINTLFADVWFCVLFKYKDSEFKYFNYYDDDNLVADFGFTYSGINLKCSLFYGQRSDEYDIVLSNDV